MVVAVIRSRIRPECAEEYYQRAEAMLLLAKSMPGFVSYKAFIAADGERVSIHEWESAEHLRAWRVHPEHVAMQRIGREQYYDEYTIYVMDSPRQSRFIRTESVA
jgi:heme-degrading monooxygenase HmoA